MNYLFSLSSIERTEKAVENESSRHIDISTSSVLMHAERLLKNVFKNRNCSRSTSLIRFKPSNVTRTLIG